MIGYTKGQVTKSEPRRSLQDIYGSEIPQGYGEDILVALPIDPDRLYIYWEIEAQKIANHPRILIDSRRKDQRIPLLEIGVSDHIGSTYVTLPPKRGARIEIALFFGEGEREPAFVKEVRMPSSTFHIQDDELWMYDLDSCPIIWGESYRNHVGGASDLLVFQKLESFSSILLTKEHKDES